MTPIQQMMLGAGGPSGPSGLASAYFDNNDERITWGASDDFVQSGDATVEAWFKRTEENTGNVYAMWEWGNHSTGADGTGGTLVYIYSNKIYLYENNDNAYNDSSALLPYNQWAHFAIVREHTSSNTTGEYNVKVYLNGTKVGSTYQTTFPWGGAVPGKTFSQGTSYGSRFQGYVSNLRITNQALYTSNFTPSTSPLTTTSQGATASNVKLLVFNDPDSLTGGTVQPNTPTLGGSPSLSTSHPF